MEPSLFKYAWRYSRGEQILVLALIVVSLPFNWISFEIPKQIVNDAIQGRAFKDGHTTALLFDWTFSLPEYLGGYVFLKLPGIAFAQVDYLFALSGLFLVFVLINGWFKYSVNIRKGILGERMLRRLRFDLFRQLMRFRPEEMRAVKPAEVASMIKDEVDPIGGFIGDAFIQPAFLITQAVTPLVFICFQNFMLGVLALMIVLVQGIIIPRLRVEQLRLGRERQLYSRELAGRIGEMVEGAPLVHTHDLVPFHEAEIGGRLGRLFGIRVDLFRRKFSVKYLNNLLAQITPFFFYAVGGYFALRQQLDIGQLVAVIAAYRDLPPPVKDLIDWDQQRNDVTIKYEQVVAQFTPARLLPDELDAGPLPTSSDINIQGLKVIDGRANLTLDRLSISVPEGSQIALVGRGSGTDALLKVLGRQIFEYSGKVELGGRSLTELSDHAYNAHVGYVGPDAHIFPGSIRDNIILSILHAAPRSEQDGELSRPEQIRLDEARRTGNPLVSDQSDWVDYGAVGIKDPAELDRLILQTMEALGTDGDIYRLGIFGLLANDAPAELEQSFVEARRVMHARMATDQMNRLIEPFDPDRYNDASTIAENLLFGVPKGDKLSHNNLAQDPYVRSILRSEALIEPITQLGLKIAEWTVETFGNLRAMPKLASRFNLFNDEDVDSLRALLELIETRGGLTHAPEEARNRLMSFALLYIEPQHRLSLLGEEFRERILRARQSFKQFLPHEYRHAIEFYDPDRFNRSAPIVDNLLFGRVAAGVGNAEQRIAKLSQSVIRDQGLGATLFRIGIDRPVGNRGRLLTPRMRTIIDIARAMLRKPSVLVLDDALSGFSGKEAAQVLAKIRLSQNGQTLIALMPDSVEPTGFDRILVFDNAVMKRDIETPEEESSARLAIPAE